MAILPCSNLPVGSIASPEIFGPKFALVTIPEWMVWEILTWVPTKSLMRFKAVSKQWCSIIQDPNFAKAHRVPLRGVLIINPHPCPSPYERSPTRNFLYANLDSSNPQTSLQFSVPKDLRTFGVTNVVNGLVCFYDRTVAKLCNIATHEIMELPASRFAYKFCTYHFGFDSINNLYKFLKICPRYFLWETASPGFCLKNVPVLSIECEILTLGVDSSWRSISPPPWALIEHSLCINGVLYWWWWRENSRFRLKAFNLSRENFECIPLPLEYDEQLPEFATSLALLMRYDDGRIEITHYDEESADWTKSHICPLPLRRDWKNDFRPFCMQPKGTLPNGKVVILDYMINVQYDTIMYLYDETKRDLQQIVLHKCLKLPTQLNFSCWGKMSCFEENIIALRCLIDPLQH